MKIEQDCYVSIDYRLSSEAGELIDSSTPGNPVGFVFGHGQMVQGLEQSLLGKAETEQVDVLLDPEQGYGLVRDELIRRMPKDIFPADIDLVPGTHLRAAGPHGPLTLTIREVGEDSVMIDLNHPLAGKRLHFWVNVVAVRKATDQELANVVTCEQQQCGVCDGGCQGLG